MTDPVNDTEVEEATLVLEDAVEVVSAPEEAPVETPVAAPAASGFGVNDLKMVVNILEVVSNRGAIKANEMEVVGNLYNKLVNFLVANGAITPAAPAAAPAPAETVSEETPTEE